MRGLLLVSMVDGDRELVVGVVVEEGRIPTIYTMFSFAGTKLFKDDARTSYDVRACVVHAWFTNHE